MGYRRFVGSPAPDRGPGTDGAGAPAAPSATSLSRAVVRWGRGVLTPAGIRGAAVEGAWIAAHLAMYPLGLLEDRENVVRARTSLSGLPPVQRGLLVGDVEAAGTPIVLVHGVVDNRSIFSVMRRALHRKGFGSTYAFNYSPFSDDIRRVAARLGDLVEDICDETGYERVHVIGHSMGGLVGRYLVQRLGGDARVHTLVTLGTPHGGTAPAALLPFPVARQMRIGGDLMREFAEPGGCRTRIVALWSDTDQLVLPHEHGRVDHPDLSTRNVMVSGVGHMSLPIDGRVVHEVCSTLAHLDPEGHARHSA